MKDTEKFSAFKKEQLDKNEVKYGTELRDKYGTETIKKSNQMYANLTEGEFTQMQRLEAQMITDLVSLKETNNLNSSLAKKIYQEHKQWLEYTWSKYTTEAHRGLVDMYLADERFSKYYDQKAKTPVVQLLHDVVYRYTNN